VTAAGDRYDVIVVGGGLAGLRERAALLNGHLTVETHPGDGAELNAAIERERQHDEGLAKTETLNLPTRRG